MLKAWLHWFSNFQCYFLEAECCFVSFLSFCFPFLEALGFYVYLWDSEIPQ